MSNIIFLISAPVLMMASGFISSYGNGAKITILITLAVDAVVGAVKYMNWYYTEEED